MWKKNIVFLLLTALIVVVTACGSEKDSIQHSIPADVGTEDYKDLVLPTNTLGFKLLSGVERDDDGNAFISPTSLVMALSMVYNSADGQTKEEIARALQIKEGMDASALNKANASLMNLLQKDTKSIELAIANSIWLNEELHFQADFIQSNEDYFNAKVEEIDIYDEASAHKINDWVASATNNKIDKMVEAPLNPDLVTYLLNAIYFKGDWTHAFSEEMTEQASFYVTEGETKEVSMMALTEELQYMENDVVQAVELPYGENETMSMQVLLPREDITREAFYEELTVEKWMKWNEAFEEKLGTVNLPKFELSYEVLLNDMLQQLGMELAFHNEAEFTKLIEETVPVWINLVKQKTFIEVNEKGTEAAAVTGVEMVTESARVDEPFFIEANRPFIVLIKDHETDALIFIGEIANPEES